MTRKTITHQTWTKCIILRHPFYFTTLPNYDSRLKPSGSSRWSQRFSQALGFARLDSVSLLFASYIDDFSSLQYRYVRGWNMRYKCFHLFMDSQPDFYFTCPTNPPASLCASRPTFSSEDLFTSVSETCMHHGAIRSRCKCKQDSVGVRRILVVPRDSGGASTGFCWCILSDKRSRC